MEKPDRKRSTAVLSGFYYNFVIILNFQQRLASGNYLLRSKL